jgi:ABC-type Na+ efflux pump permease subunit
MTPLSFDLDLLTALTGYAGATLVVAAFFLTGPRRILAVSFVSSALWIVHFFLIGAWAGVIISIASAVRNAAGAWLERRTMIVVTWVCVAVVVGMVLTFDPAGAVVILAAPARAIGNHLRNHEIPFRICCALSGLSYVAYGIAIQSPLAISSAIAVAVILGVPLFHHLKAQYGRQSRRA